MQLTRQPDHVDAHFNLGTLFRRGGRLDEAVAAYCDALRYAPDYADAHNNLGLVYAEQGRTDEAIACYRRALELDPKQTHAQNNLGNALRAQGRYDEAVACYEKVLAASSDHTDAYVNLGNVRAEQGRFAEARTLYETALKRSPRSIDIHRNMGRLMLLEGRSGEALAHYRRALELDPGLAETCNDLGEAYRQCGNFEQAEKCFRQAIAINSSDVDALYNLAETLKVQDQLVDAAALDERVLALRADYFPALASLIHLRQHMCAWDGIEALWKRLRSEAIGGNGAGVSPFSILSQPTSAAEQLACARSWAAQKLAPLVNARARLGFDFSRRQRAPGRLRIGYLSWDYHKHATSYLIAELFALHNRDRFEIFAYDYGPDDGSAIRERIVKSCERFVVLGQASHVAAAEQIYRDGIDILVDMKGYTMAARTQIMALRPAPIQVNWLGYPGTMGSDCHDYIIADPHIIPEGMERFYSEQVMRLPDCYQINDRHREIAERTPTRTECGLPEHGFVFCCFNLSYKILPDVFARWMRIMRAFTGSVLWLLETNPWAVENLRRAAAAQEVDPGRLVFAPRKPMPEHLARYRLADLALDTFPYTSHTTASDALWAGCPLVTCMGETFASRVAGSILINAGMRELVTESSEAYEKLVENLVGAPDQLRDVRRRLQEGRNSCALFDTPRFVKNLECAYEQMLGNCPT